MSTIESTSINDHYEEEQRVLRERVILYETLKKIMKIRMFLLSIGEYELEDGEILELN
jgi:hypothetical protein